MPGLPSSALVMGFGWFNEDYILPSKMVPRRDKTILVALGSIATHENTTHATCSLLKGTTLEVGLCAESVWSAGFKVFAMQALGSEHPLRASAYVL